MNRIITIIFGAVSCIITAFINFYFQEITGINIFSFSMFFVIPVGAIAVGMAACSGYYFSALMTNRMLDKYDFLAMVVMAGAGMFLIYGIEYYHYIEQAGLSKDITFWQYIVFVVENSTYRLKLTKISLFSDVGTLGSFGYLFLVTHFLGFIIGGATTFLLLFGEDTCSQCSKYFRNKKKKVLFFNKEETFDNYKHQIDEMEPSSITFKSILFDGSDTQSEKKKGSLKYTWVLKKCNTCNAELLKGNADIYQDKDWSPIKETDKKIIMPINSNLEQQWDT